MGKIRLIATGVRKDKGRDGKGKEIEVVTTEVDTRPDACKECKKEHRMQGSSRCRKCSESYRNQNLPQRVANYRLEKKIESQLKK